jgi:trigger factor
MTVELPADEINLEVEKRLKDLARTARMDGFRPGKVPLKVLRSRYGPRLQREVFGEMIQSTFARAAAQEKLRPAGAPSIEPDLGQGRDQATFAYTAVFEVMPEIELASLSGRRVERPTSEITDTDLDDMIARLQKQRQTWAEVERPAQDGDQVRISFRGTVDGEGFQGGEATDVPLVLGSGVMLEGFEAGLRGATAGEARTLSMEFPADYRAEHLAGRPVRFDTEVLKVSEPVLPPVDGEFARSFGVESGDLEQFRREIRSNMERELRQRIQARLKKQAMDLLLETHPVALPKALIDQEVEGLREQTQQGARTGGRMELPRELFEEQARRRVALGLIIAEVVKKVGIEVDQERVRRTIEEFAATYENPQQVIGFYNNPRQRASVENLVLEDQVVDWVLSQVQVDEVPRSFAEVTAGED